MSIPLSREAIESHARELINASETPLGVEVTTPVVYPNGDCIVVLVATEGDGYVAHDAGLGAMYMSHEGVRLGRDIASRIAAIAGRYGCVYQSGRITRHCDADGVATSLMLVANASRSVGDMAIEARRQLDGHFRQVLTERVREIAGGRLRENESFKGKSGIAYRVANTILDANAKDPVAFVMPLASRSSVSGLFRELYDLQAAFPDISRESIYDENSDFRPTEDGWVLRQVGDVVPFSNTGAVLQSLLSLSSRQSSLPS